ncbi:glycosyltransferase [Catellatospora tritici]|uniref:glycosyltransferase n=1 Tax=Catellatospora tritici TaxID=2851566 RepID=UPI001C2DA809|nr:galactosyltransferase-related protein [Catellatospora tritici]MBV1849426.1 glycosyltransferase [Catellatospora tritici]
MQPRPCDCTPMCVLRTTNPMKIRATRVPEPSYAEASVYRAADPEGDDLAKRLTRYVVLAHDPAVRDVAADYWLHSETFYAAVMAELDVIAAADPTTEAALRRLVADPTDAAAERRLEALLTLLLGERPELFTGAAAALRDADANVFINYLRGPDHRAGAEPVATDRLWAWASETMPPPQPRDDADVLVVIPIMDRGGSGRLRNLLACLLGLRDQSLPASRYRVAVVEFDTEPRWQHLIEPLVDHYFHIPGPGSFNKSWAINVGVRQTPGDFTTLCLLDADILADRWFLERNLARFDDPLHDAHLPHTEFLSLDTASSDRLIAQRCFAATAAPPLAQARGLLLRDVPGACMWIRPELFHRIGGFDERYQGWGGEDEDIIVRATAAGTVVQYDDVLIHMAHLRPSMRNAAGQPYNGHLTVGTWSGANGYGELLAPAAA